MLERTAAQSAALADELRKVLHETQELISALSQDKDDAIVALRGRVAIAVDRAKRRLAEFEAHAKRLKQDAGAATDLYVRENPWTVVSLAAALGLMLGAWVGSAASADDSDAGEQA